MGKNKLKKFADMERFGCVLQYPREELLRLGFPHVGKWNGDVFASPAPLTLELGCGRGEYTVGPRKSERGRNFVGIDIKGARMWTGAKEVEENGIPNAAFLRCEIENIDRFFAPAEVDSLWITFPDPQMKNPQAPGVYAFPCLVPQNPATRRHREPEDRLPLPVRVHAPAGGAQRIRDA